jgi:hypothetical protein
LGLNSCTDKGVPLPIDNKLIDNLLKDYKTPEEILGDHGLLKQLILLANPQPDDGASLAK